MPRLFTQGFTTKREGHGYGLHSSANAAKSMGGTIVAASPGSGHGATFTLDLPLNKDAQAGPTAPADAAVVVSA